MPCASAASTRTCTQVLKKGLRAPVPRVPTPFAHPPPPNASGLQPSQITDTVYPMYKAFIEPDLKLAQLRIYNSFNPFAGARPGPGAPVCGHR